MIKQEPNVLQCKDHSTAYEMLFVLFLTVRLTLHRWISTIGLISTFNCSFFHATISQFQYTDQTRSLLIMVIILHSVLSVMFSLVLGEVERSVN